MTDSSDVDVCREKPPGSMCNRQRFYKKRPLRFYCNPVSSIFSTFSVDIQVNFCLICIQLHLQKAMKRMAFQKRNEICGPLFYFDSKEERCKAARKQCGPWSQNKFNTLEECENQCLPKKRK